MRLSFATQQDPLENLVLRLIEEDFQIHVEPPFPRRRANSVTKTTALLGKGEHILQAFDMHPSPLVL